MSNDLAWMGRPVDGMSRAELLQALKAALLLLRSVGTRTFVRPDLEVRDTPAGTLVARTFNWAFLPAGHVWSDEDRRSVQERLDAIADRHGLQGAVVRFAPDRLEVEVPRRLQAEQLVVLQEWLATEKDALDISQVP